MVHYDKTRSDHHRDAVIGFILTKDPHLLFIAGHHCLGSLAILLTQTQSALIGNLAKLSRLQEKSLPIKADNAF